MAAKKTPKKPSKSAFIRSLPSELSVADVIAKGKEAGLKFTSSLVYMVRGPAGGKATPKKTAAKAASKKVSASRKKATPKKIATASKATAPKTGENKAAFVRQHASLSPKEIVSKAKAAGIELGVTYVYNVRGQDKTAAKKKGKRVAGPKESPLTTSTPKGALISTPPKTVPRGDRSSGSVEDLLKAAASELGLGRALEVLQGERARVQAVLGR